MEGAQDQLNYPKFNEQGDAANNSIDQSRGGHRASPIPTGTQFGPFPVQGNVSNENDNFMSNLNVLLAQARNQTSESPRWTTNEGLAPGDNDVAKSKEERINHSQNYRVFEKKKNKNYHRPHNRVIRGNYSRVRFLQQNCNKSSVVNREIRDDIGRKRIGQYVFMATEPGLARKYSIGPRVPCALQPTKNTFYKLEGDDNDIRSCIVADDSQEMNLLPQFSSRDVVSVEWHVPLEEEAKRKGSCRLGPCRKDSSTAESCCSSVTQDAESSEEETTSDCSMASIDSATNEDTRSSRTRAHWRTLGSPGNQRQTRAQGRKRRGTSFRSPRIENTGDNQPYRTSPQQGRHRKDGGDIETSPQTSVGWVESELQDSLMSDGEDYSPEREGPGTGANSADHQPQSTVVLICSVYWDAQMKSALPQEVTNLLSFAEEMGHPVILCGDLNAHSVLWGSPTSDARGEMIEDLTTIFDLSVLNDGNHHTYEKGDAQTHIDVSLVSNSIAHRFRNWEVTNYPTFSDHNRIEFDMSTGLPSLQLGRNLRKANWDEFRAEVQAFHNLHPIPEKWNQTVIDAQVSILETSIQVGLDKVAPLRPRMKRFRSPYRDPEVLKIAEKCKKLRNRQRRTPADVAIRKEFRAACQKKKFAYRKADLQRWKNFTTEIADPNGAAKLLRAMKKDAFVPPTLIRDDDKYTTGKKETIELLLDTHFPGSMNQPEPELDHYFNDIVDELNGPQKIQPIRWINHDRVRRALSSFSDYKACGPDDIKPIVLKRLPDNAIDRLVAIYTASVKLGYVPHTWTKSRTVFIPKPGRDDYSIPKSFRPISLTSFCFKTLERLVLWHLEQTTFRRKPFHTKQHAFRKGHSTELAISEVVDKIESAIHNNKIAMVAFLDIEGAFDNLQTSSAIKAMKDHQIDDNIVKWYSYYLHNRSSTVQYGDKHSQRLLTKGTPQGGVLSPILWNLSFDDLLSKFDKGDVRICGFADDASIFTTSYSPTTAIPRIQKGIDKCVAWGKKKGLKFSAKKTQVVIFHRKSKMDLPEKKITMNGKDIEYSKQCRYLGVTLDEQLKWILHFSKKMKVAKALLFKMKNALGITWGLKPHLLRWVYTGIVRPAIIYGSLAWGHSVRYKYQFNKLEKLQAIILRMLAPKRKSTPNAGLEMIGYLPPLDIFLKGEGVKAFIRNKEALPKGWNGLDKKKRLVGHLAIAKTMADKMNIPDTNWDRGPAEIHFEKPFEIDTQSFERGEDISPNNALICYTDGSKQTKDKVVGVGSGYTIIETNNKGDKKHLKDASFHLRDFNSVYQAEVTAITKAAQHLHKLDEKQLRKTTYILTDSRSALHALQRHWICSRSVNQCQQALRSLATKTTIKLRWIKAHVQHEGNERADSLAKAGACAHMKDVELNGLVVEDLNDVPPPYSHLVQLVTLGVENSWAKRWMDAKKEDGSPKYRQTKFFFKAPDKAKAYHLMRANRESLGIMIQFITGHTFLRRHQGLIDKSADPDASIDKSCRLCKNGEETPFHLVMECEELTHHRSRLFRHQKDRPTDPDCTIQWSVRSLASFISSDDIGLLLKSDEEDEQLQDMEID